MNGQGGREVRSQWGIERGVEWREWAKGTGIESCRRMSPGSIETLIANFIPSLFLRLRSIR